MPKKHDILAFGSCYVDTNLSQYPFTPEGIPTNIELSGSTYETVAGGSAVNFCRLLTMLDVRTAFIGATGDDKNSTILAQLLEEAGVAHHLIRLDTMQTNISFNMTNPEGQHIQLTAGNANSSLNPEVVLPKLASLLPETNFLYLGGCFKLKAFQDAFTGIAQLAEEHNTKIIVDHGRIPDNTPESMLVAVQELVKKSAFYLPSRKEFCALWQTPTIEEGLSLLQKQAPNTTVIVKDGENGIHYISDGTIHHAPAQKAAHIQSATGAGDSFNSGLIAGTVQGLAIADAVKNGQDIAFKKVTGDL